MTRFMCEPRNYSDIKHIDGCHSTVGCRCGIYEHLNPRPPQHIKDEYQRLLDGESRCEDPDGD